MLHEYTYIYMYMNIYTYKMCLEVKRECLLVCFLFLPVMITAQSGFGKQKGCEEIDLGGKKKIVVVVVVHGRCPRFCCSDSSEPVRSVL